MDEKAEKISDAMSHCPECGKENYNEMDADLCLTCWNCGCCYGQEDLDERQRKDKHIKTGADIHNELDMTYETTNESERDRLSGIKWVSVSWLKEQIEERKKTYEYVHYKRATSALDFVLSLLEG